jgi:hydrogenase-4 membrane subunit HyfE
LAFGILDLSVGFSLLGGLIAFGLLLVAVAAFRRHREPAFAFLIGAFTVFFLKSFLVAYSLKTEAIGHEYLEFVDSVGDVATLLLITLPILWPAR